MWYLLDELRKSWLAPAVALQGPAIPTHTLACHSSLSQALTSLCTGSWGTLSCCSRHKTTQQCCNSRALHSGQDISESKSWWKSYTGQLIIMNPCLLMFAIYLHFLNLPSSLWRGRRQQFSNIWGNFSKCNCMLLYFWSGGRKKRSPFSLSCSSYASIYEWFIQGRVSL